MVVICLNLKILLCFFWRVLLRKEIFVLLLQLLRILGCKSLRGWLKSLRSWHGSGSIWEVGGGHRFILEGSDRFLSELNPMLFSKLSLLNYNRELRNRLEGFRRFRGILLQSRWLTCLSFLRFNIMIKLSNYRRVEQAGGYLDLLLDCKHWRSDQIWQLCRLTPCPVKKVCH